MKNRTVITAIAVVAVLLLAELGFIAWMELGFGQNQPTEPETTDGQSTSQTAQTIEPPATTAVVEGTIVQPETTEPAPQPTVGSNQTKTSGTKTGGSSGANTQKDDKKEDPAVTETPTTEATQAPEETQAPTTQPPETEPPTTAPVETGGAGANDGGNELPFVPAV